MSLPNSLTILQTFADELAHPDRDILELELDVCIVSLFGKLGSAQMSYEVTHYDKSAGLFKVENISDTKLFWQALCMSSGTMDGARKRRFVI